MSFVINTGTSCVCCVLDGHFFDGASCVVHNKLTFDDDRTRRSDPIMGGLQFDHCNAIGIGMMCVCVVLGSVVVSVLGFRWVGGFDGFLEGFGVEHEAVGATGFSSEHERSMKFFYLIFDTLHYNLYVTYIICRLI